jgi:hypothetical protein
MQDEFARLRAIREEKEALLLRVQAARAAVLLAEGEVESAKLRAAEASAAGPPKPLPGAPSSTEEAPGPSSSPAPPSEASRYTASLSIPRAPALLARGAIDVEFSVSVESGAGPGESDYLALYRGSQGPPTPQHAQEEHVSLEYTDGALQGRKRLTLPSSLPAGQEFSVCYCSAAGEVLCCKPLESQAAVAGASGARKQPKAAPSPPRPLLAPFLLESQPRISTIQLTVPLPAHVRAAAASGSGGPGTANEDLNVLPKDWMPGLRVEGDHTQGTAGGMAPSAVFLAMQLPRCKGVPAYAVGSDGAAAASPAANSGGVDVYALRVPLAQRVESQKVVTRVYADHVAVRLPMFYAGSAVPDKPPSLISLEELASLRENGWRTSCRFCGLPILLASSSSSSSGAAAAARVVKLPSEHWMEWTDFWVCHDAEDNCLLPVDGVGDSSGIRGTLLVGETTLQPHILDTFPGALTVGFPSKAARALVEGAVAGAGGAREECRTLETVVAALQCARCKLTVGSVTLPLASLACGKGGDGGGDGGGCCPSPLQPTTTSSLGGCEVFLLGAPQGAPSAAPSPPTLHLFPSPARAGSGPLQDCCLPRSLTTALHPTVKLHKDALCTPTARSLPPLLPGRPPRQENALLSYTLTSRLACSMLAAATALRHYTFDILVADGCTEQPQAAVELLLRVALVNWNTSLRVGLAGGVPHSEGLRERWVHAGDLPCLKVRYRYDGAGFEEGGGGGGGGALHSPEPEALMVTQEEARELVAVLTESTGFLPPTQRALDGAFIGFLPFLASPVRVFNN